MKKEILLGAHVSIAGGVQFAPIRGEEIGCTAIQIFTRNQRQWTSPPLKDYEVEEYFSNLKQTNIKSVVAHSSYLINLASPDKKQLQKSTESFILEFERAERLRAAGYIFHPGSFKESSEKEGIKRIVEQLDLVLSDRQDFQTKILLETTAGQGTALGRTFEQLAEIISRSKFPEKLGVCLDTCHVFAAGYDLRSQENYDRTMKQFDEVIGIQKLNALHLNDSKTDLGSFVDRHEMIGLGKLGIEAFRLIMNDERLSEVPKIIELPGGPQSDKRNLEILRNLVKTDGQN